MSTGLPSWRQKAAGGLVLLLMVAVVARTVWELLAPLVPVLVVGVVLLGVYAVVLERGRR